MRTFLKLHGTGMIVLVLSLCLTVDLGLAYLMGKPNGAPVWTAPYLNVGLNTTQTYLSLLALIMFSWKAGGSLHFMTAFRDKRWGGMAASAALFLCALTFSVLLEWSWYQQTISAQSMWAADAKSDHVADTSRIDWLQAQIQAAPAARASADIDAEINTTFQQLVGPKKDLRTLTEYTAGCSNDKTADYPQCFQVAKLREQKTKALTLEHYQGELVSLRSKRSGNEAPVDLMAFSAVLAETFGGKRDFYIYFVAALVMVFLQLGSATLPLITFGGDVKKRREDETADLPKPLTAILAAHAVSGMTKTRGLGLTAGDDALIAPLVASEEAPTAANDETDPGDANVMAWPEGATVRAVAASGNAISAAVGRRPVLVSDQRLVLPGDKRFDATLLSDQTEAVRAFAREHLRDSLDGAISSKNMWLAWQELTGGTLGRNAFSIRLASTLNESGRRFTRGREGGGLTTWYGLELSDEATLGLLRINRTMQAGREAGQLMVA